MSEEPIRNIDQAEDPANDAPPATSEPATDGEVKLQEAEAVKKVGGDALQDEDDKKEDVGASESPSDEDIVTKLREYLSADDMDFQKVTGARLPCWAVLAALGTSARFGVDGQCRWTD